MKQIIGYVIVDTSAGGLHVSEPFLPKAVMAAEAEMRRRNREAGTSKYSVKALLAPEPQVEAASAEAPASCGVARRPGRFSFEGPGGVPYSKGMNMHVTLVQVNNPRSAFHGFWRAALVIDGRQVWATDTGERSWALKVAAKLWPTLEVR
jgi:hypothetical protein